jgi:hypothetical protein
MCGGCSSDNNQTNMTFQIWGVGMSSLGVAAGVAWVFHVGLTIWMVAVAVDRDRDGDRDRDWDRDGNGGGDDGEQRERWKIAETAETMREVADNWNGWWRKMMIELER